METILVNLFFVLSIAGLLCACSLGDSADGCCGSHGQYYENEDERKKDRHLGAILGIPSLVIFLVVFSYAASHGITILGFIHFS